MGAMSTVTRVVIPWRDAGCPHRRAHFWRLLRWYEDAGLRVTVGTGDRRAPFSRSAARNDGVATAKLSGADAVVIVDADNLIDPSGIRAAGALAVESGRMVKPFTRFGYLDQATTDAWYADGARGMIDHNTAGWEGAGLAHEFTGGAWALSIEAFDRVGGFDTGFVGWGAEDDAFTIACTKTLGPPLTRAVPGVDLHLWHPTSERFTSPENYQKLMREYVNGD